jgi:hypothetical protein
MVRFGSPRRGQPLDDRRGSAADDGEVNCGGDDLDERQVLDVGGAGRVVQHLDGIGAAGYPMRLQPPRRQRGE